MKTAQLINKSRGLLIIDDEIEITKTLVRQFKRRYTVFSATNTDDAFQILEKESVQVVISDQRMPGMTGVEFFTSIKTKYPDTIRLILTGYSDIEAAIAAINHGQVFRYITKPWHPNELDSIIKEAFEKHELLAKNRDLFNNLTDINNHLEEKVMLRTREIEQHNKVLKESEEMMRNSQSVAHICSYSTNLKVDDIAKSAWVCSPEFYQIFGIDKTYPHTIEGWAAFIHPDYREEMVAYHEYVIKEKIRFEHEYKIIRINDGVERWVYGTGKLEFDEKGNPIRMHGAIQDITERKDNERALLASEKDFRNLIELSPIAMVVIREWRTLYFNPAAVKLFGAKDQSEILNRDIYQFIHPYFHRLTVENAKLLARDGYVDMQEQKYIKLDGSILDVETRAKSIRYNDTSATLIVINDITERKKLQVLLENERALYLDLVNTQPAGIYRIKVYSKENWKDNAWLNADNPPYKMELVSERFGEILEISTDTFRTNPGIIIDLVHPDDKTEFVRRNEEANTLIQTFSWDCRLLINNKIKWIHFESIPRKLDNGDILFTGIIYDITERKNSEKALKESEEKLNTLFNTMTEIVVMHELVFNANGDAIDYKITDCNKAFSDFLGIKYEDIVGKPATTLYATDTPPYLKEYVEVCVSGKSIEFNSYFEPMDKYFLISAVTSGKNRFSTISTDVTTHEQVNKVIKDKNKELENFIYVASHDLRSPLVNIQGFSQRLQKQASQIRNLVSGFEIQSDLASEIDKLTTLEIPKSVSFILNNVSKMESLINSLLQLSRSGQIKLNVNLLDMNNLLNKIISTYNFQLTELNADVIVHDLIECYGDENQLNQLFSNIIGNAIKYSDKNRRLIIEISSKAHHNNVIYTIKDNGIGINQQHLDRIWDVFYRVDSTASQTGEGLGLSLAKLIAEKHLGKIWALSTEGVGSTFFVELHRNNFEKLN